MKDDELFYLCRCLADLSGIPTRLFRGETMIGSWSFVHLPADPMELYREEIFAVQDHVGYFMTPLLHIYGIIRSDDIRIVVGPTAQILAPDRKIRELGLQLNLDREGQQQFLAGMKSIIRMPLESLLLMLCPVNFELNHEMLELRNLTIREEEQQRLKQATEEKRTENIYDMEPSAAIHNTIQTEETLLAIVMQGDVSRLDDWAKSAPAVRGGVIARDQLRQLKNTFIVTTTLVSRAAIRGGLDIEDALSLSDSYIQRCEMLTGQEQIMDLQLHMVREFTEQVGKARLSESSSRLEAEVMSYIQHHLSEPIRVEEMADYFGFSRTHFSAKFRQETGMTLTDFILRQKTEEAKRLLRYSDRSAAAIAAYLGFSSHAHMNKVFKKYSGETPLQYREKYTTKM
ncbi:MAG: helix-turn-helix domain-containing protein [Lachnospiraceae bacterium]|nr:helix-turn-helix domain-containing protein [Lachnospiraceae bacterium]